MSFTEGGKFRAGRGMSLSFQEDKLVSQYLRTNISSAESYLTYCRAFDKACLTGVPELLGKDCLATMQQLFRARYKVNTLAKSH